MSGPDLYAVLGVGRKATAEELAATYRQRVRLTHPDAGGDTLAFRAVQGGYEILRDPGLGPATTPSSTAPAAAHRGRRGSHPVRRVKVVPGGWWWVASAASWVAVVLWCLAGVWVGAAHAEPRMSRVAWMLAWWLDAAVVAWHLLRVRWSVLVVAAVVLAWPAHTSPGSGCSWVVYGWLVGAVGLPWVRAAVTRPL